MKKLPEPWFLMFNSFKDLLFQKSLTAFPWRFASFSNFADHFPKFPDIPRHWKNVFFPWLFAWPWTPCPRSGVVFDCIDSWSLPYPLTFLTQQYFLGLCVYKLNAAKLKQYECFYFSAVFGVLEDKWMAIFYSLDCNFGRGHHEKH